MASRRSPVIGDTRTPAESGPDPFSASARIMIWAPMEWQSARTGRGAVGTTTVSRNSRRSAM